MALLGLLQKSDNADFLQSLAKAVLQLLKGRSARLAMNVAPNG